MKFSYVPILQVRLLLLPTKKTRHKTKIKPGEAPEFNETFEFKVPPGSYKKRSFKRVLKRKRGAIHKSSHSHCYRMTFCTSLLRTT